MLPYFVRGESLGRNATSCKRGSVTKAKCGQTGLHDIFEIDVYYHHSCYLRFTRSSPTSQSNTISDTQQLGEAEFLTYVKIKIMFQKNAYLLLHDITSFSEEHSLEPFISNKRTLSRFL